MRRIALTLLLGVALILSCGNDVEKSSEVENSGAGQATSSGTETLTPALLDRVAVPFNRGVALMDQFQPKEAVAAFDEVVAIAPDWILGHLNLGIALLNAQEFSARAESELRWVIQRQPDNPYAHYALGMLLRHQSRMDEAKAEFEAVLRIDPEDADAHYQMGFLIQEEDPDAAQVHLEKTLAKIPHHESAAYNLAMMLRRRGERERAMTLLNRVQVLRKFKAGTFSGMKYGEMGRYAEVIRAFDSPAMVGEPRTPLSYTDVATAMGLTEPAQTAPGLPSAATSFAPGIAVADIRGKGEISVYLTGTTKGGTLYHRNGGEFSLATDSGIDGRNAVGAWFGDYDGDGDPDLYLTCRGPNRLYRNEGNGSFSDVTSVSGTAGAEVLSVGAAWIDADHDGDLDLYVGNHSNSRGEGTANAFWRNNGNGTFTDLAGVAGIDGGSAATSAVLAFDFDDDRDLDLYLVNDGSPNRLFLNERVGNYSDATEWNPQLADEGPGLGALLGDLDGNGREDLLLLRGAMPPRLFLCTERGVFTEDKAFAAIAEKLGGAASGLMGDLDLDGNLDLVLVDAGEGETFGHRILMNRGAGRFDEPLILGGTSGQPRGRGALALDLDGDGCLELLIARAGATPQVWRATPPANRHWLAVLPAMAGEDNPLWLDPTASGLMVEIKAGRRLQVAGLNPSSGYLASAPLRAHFGLGSHAAADYVRLNWTDGVIQSEIEVAADQAWRIGKMVRKPSSCPILFSWDGQRFAYVTDFLGVGGSGFFVAPGLYAKPDPDEHVRIPPDQIQPKDGQFLIRITEPLEEVTYLDYVRLIGYDHPDDREIYPDERFASGEPYASGRPRAVEKKIFPAAARDYRGRDVLDKVQTIDRGYVKPPPDPRFKGYAEDHWLELDFSGKLSQEPTQAPLILYLYGWVEYTFSHVNYAAWQAGIAMQAPRIEVPDGHGEWRVAMPDAGFPAGLPRMMTVDVSNLGLAEDGRLRIRTNMQIFWDQAFLAVDTADQRIQRHVLAPVSADLRYLGYPREFSPDGGEPTVYDYHRVDRGVPFKNMSGGFTRFGEVGELLHQVDDRFVIMGRGEEIALAFNASALPPLQPGWTRTFVLHADGYCKDMDLYTAFPDTVEPIPHHGMDNYPPSQAPANEAELARDRSRWNTRKVGGRTETREQLQNEK